MPIVSGATGSGSTSPLLFYAEITSPVTISATSEGAAQDVVSLGAQTYAAVPTVIEFFCPHITPASASQSGIFFLLQDGATVLGQLTFINQWGAAGSAALEMPVSLARRLTPTAASHTYKITAYRLTVNWTVSAAGGGSGTYLPTFIRASLA